MYKDVQEVRTAFDTLSQCRMLPTLLDVFLDDMRQELHLITDDVEEFMAQYEATSDPLYVGQMVARLLEWYKAWAPIPELGGTLSKSYTEAFRTHVFSILPPSFSAGFKALVAVTFNLTQDPSASGWMLNLFPPPTQGPYSRADVPLWNAFEQLGMQERYETLISSVCYEYIENHILETCAKEWDRPMLYILREWMTNRIVPWMVLPYAKGARNAEEARTMLQGIGSRLDFHVCKTLATLRNVCSASTIGHNWFKVCGQRMWLVDLYDITLTYRTLGRNRRRLLHPGADTKTILMQSQIQSVGTSVASLVGDGESGDSLVDENEPIQPLQQAQLDDYGDPNWEPEPIDAGPEFRANRPSDIISTLVSIYDSKELFVKELQVLLAQRLLAIKDGNFDRERRNIEILKIRFGEAALQVCEVMLRDMTDSKRTDQHIQSQEQFMLHPTIISRHFWPPLQSSTFKMPGQFRQIQENYAKEYVKFKPDKKLVWMSHLGTVNIEVELDDRTVTADVPPLEAAFIELFSTKDVWSITELVKEVGSIDRSSAIRALTTWTELGVLKEDSADTFRLLKVAEEAGPSMPSSSRTDDAEQEPPVFIEGMLKNLGTLPLDRIQQMLKFAPGYNRNIEQLGAYLAFTDKNRKRNTSLNDTLICDVVLPLSNQ
ncbi:hypothetical protein EW026_g872 [Hermanssonia centrifuga]|uniref:Anaphase-promoting complex subunit 2 n=1 Tax=Hermanssonia centrifuga TaxID=98765 RepID=A0A4S4KV39_9APHY|nr:hypothetical protein EW026_g872 [Hermanssonia centrifuga]